MNKIWQAVGIAFLTMASFQVWAADFFDETFGNLQEELEVAKDDGKQGIFIFFHMEECPFCDRMKNTILNKPDVIQYFKQHFLTYQVDIEGSNEMVNFDGTEGTAQYLSEKVYRVRATPVMMVFNLEGKPVLRYTGPTRTKEEFMLLGKYVVDGAYKDMSFTRYKRQNK
ncbi:thioredoxin family protein [Thiomicrospira sp. S5]|jgi:thioredoxin-related protein|uniref:thioredoxin family protein n=1 Tax=Thiomicrospira sp. S5 TaxID=1803865 RepID=UPI0004A706FB|nr:thioredoxin family protein [Thiomicrospira sp. S5]AZR82678.1 thioredoxin [Thiomicrospira sp. S5]